MAAFATLCWLSKMMLKNIIDSIIVIGDLIRQPSVNDYKTVFSISVDHSPVSWIGHIVKNDLFTISLDLKVDY